MELSSVVKLAQPVCWKEKVKGVGIEVILLLLDFAAKFSVPLSKSCMRIHDNILISHRL